MKNTLTKIELFDQLNDCLEKLILFNQIYDSGNLSIAKEIAVKLRILFHNTNNSKSLIKQLRLEHILFIDTASKYDPRNYFPTHGLLYIFSDNFGGCLVPKLNKSENKSVTLENWWNSKIVISDKMNNLFTRKKIVLELVNTDGGAHVDSALNVPYYDLSRANTLGWIYHDGITNKEKPLNDPIPPCIRQISYETILTFQNTDLEKESKLIK
jgi:hypothetical protein